MTTIKITKQNGNITGFSVTGHSDYAESGSDIVCASISALAQSTALGISKVLNINVITKQNVNVPSFQVRFSKKESMSNILKAQVLLSTFELASKNIASQYKKYIKLEEEYEIY